MSDEKSVKPTDGEATFKFKDQSFRAAQPLTFKADEYDCPVCGVVSVYISVTIGDPELDGMYCQKCYARWLNKNLPRITKRTTNDHCRCAETKLHGGETARCEFCRRATNESGGRK